VRPLEHAADIGLKPANVNGCMKPDRLFRPDAWMMIFLIDLSK